MKQTLHKRFSQFSIDYESLLLENQTALLEDSWRRFIAKASQIWIHHYRQMTGGEANIYEFQADVGFFTLFDLAAERLSLDPDEGIPETEDRVVGVHGRSHTTGKARDTNRQRGFIGPTQKVFPENYEKGHYIAHSMGGGMDVNLFPQAKPLNRGWSEAGKRYRTMENHCADNPGTHCFVRPLYQDHTWIPAVLEFGMMRKDASLWVEWFENSP
ncbi:MAG: DNA/RNA non-specific endonuclease [Magnetococcales bacterium]|nr:DNA/RNA non-specific endonuclease [Magnetococcales bacterium]